MRRGAMTSSIRTRRIPIPATPPGYPRIENHNLERCIPFIIIVVLLLGSATAVAQMDAAPPNPTGSIVSEVDVYVKVIGAAIGAVAALLGLPIIFLTYRKTRVEIAKLELEEIALREQHGQRASRSRYEEGNINVAVHDSPNARIEVRADPRFLAPLLILLDFILAWILLTVINYLLSLFNLGLLRELGMLALAGILLFPIGQQVLRVRAVLRPPLTSEEARELSRPARMAGYVTYIMLMMLSLAFGILLLIVSPSTLTAGYIAWAVIMFGVLMLVLVPLIKPRFDRYIISLQQ